MEDLPLGRIAALVPEFAVKFLPLGRTHDDDDDDHDDTPGFRRLRSAHSIEKSGVAQGCQIGR